MGVLRQRFNKQNKQHTWKSSKDSLARQKKQYTNFIKTWQTYVTSYQKPQIFGCWVVWNKESPFSGNHEINHFRENETYNLSSG